jgi:ssDNA-binding Zn-finger/Zn-ribbon topoisomerase 1
MLTHLSHPLTHATNRANPRRVCHAHLSRLTHLPRTHARKNKNALSRTHFYAHGFFMCDKCSKCSKLINSKSYKRKWCDKGRDKGVTSQQLEKTTACTTWIRAS